MNIFNEPIFFAQSHYWFMLVPIVGMIGVAFFALQRRKKIMATLAHERWQKFLISGYSWPRSIGKFIALTIGYISLGLLFLQPQWGKKKSLINQHARDIVIALDISRSMLVQDLEPNRLEMAKQKIKNIVAHLPAERLGLVLFAGSAIVQCPLTTDYKAFQSFLDQIGSDTISRGSTSIAAALHKIMAMFADHAHQSKVVILLTDGEDFSEDLSALKEQAKKEGIALVTLGVGTLQGGPIPCIDAYGTCTGYQKNEEGSIILSKLDENLLRDMANALGGMYMHAASDDADCKAIAHYVAQFERAFFESSEVEEFENRYSWFAAIAFIALLIEWLV